MPVAPPSKLSNIQPTDVENSTRILFDNRSTIAPTYLGYARCGNFIVKQASSHGQVVKAEDSWLRSRGFKPPTVETIFHVPFIWIKAWKQKLSGNQPGIVAYAVILQKGGWILRTVGL